MNTVRGSGRFLVRGRRLGLALALGVSSLVAQRPAAGTTGAFRAGDRIYLRVEGEKQLSDTFTVHAGPAIELPSLGVVSLVGVRREEIGPYLTKEIRKYVKEPVITVHALMRIGVLGELTHPGFHDIPSDAVLADAFTAAGGPTKDAGITKLRLERSGVVISSGETLRKALDQGTTLDQLGLQSGDELIVPPRTDAERVWRIVAIIVSIPAAIVAASLLRR